MDRFVKVTKKRSIKELLEKERLLQKMLNQAKRELEQLRRTTTTNIIPKKSFSSDIQISLPKINSKESVEDLEKCISCSEKFKQISFFNHSKKFIEMSNENEGEKLVGRMYEADAIVNEIVKLHISFIVREISTPKHDIIDNICLEFEDDFHSMELNDTIKLICNNPFHYENDLNRILAVLLRYSKMYSIREHVMNSLNPNIFKSKKLKEGFVKILAKVNNNIILKCSWKIEWSKSIMNLVYSFHIEGNEKNMIFNYCTDILSQLVQPFTAETDIEMYANIWEVLENAISEQVE